MRNIKLTLSYDGTNYHGWQIQDKLPTPCGALREAILRLTGENVQIIGASRIDAGGHALGQVVNFKTAATLPISSYPRALNAHLPSDIVVYGAEEVDDGFHARFSARSRVYEYVILSSEYPSPIYRNYAHWVAGSLSLRKIKRASRVFIGTHDFTSFASLGGEEKNPVRTIYGIYTHQERISHQDTKTQRLDQMSEVRGQEAGGRRQEAEVRSQIKKDSPYILSSALCPLSSVFRIRLEGDSFLPGMVRTIVAALIEVGMGRLEGVHPVRDVSLNGVKEILEAKDRASAPAPASACGLYLVRVEY